MQECIKQELADEEQRKINYTIKYYQQFIGIWKNGDEDLVALKDARKRLKSGVNHQDKIISCLGLLSYEGFQQIELLSIRFIFFGNLRFLQII